MSNLNKALLIGRLTKDPEMRYTPSGTAVTSFSIATNRWSTGPDGERKEFVDYHNIVAYPIGKRNLAETVAQYTRKGALVYVEGRIQTRSWEGQDGQKRRVTEIIANDVQFLEPRGAGVGAGAGAGAREGASAGAGAATDTFSTAGVFSGAEAAAPQGLQLLPGEGLVHRLQGGLAPPQVRQRPRQDPAAPRDGHVRPAPAAADHSPRARSRDRSPSVHDRTALRPAVECGRSPHL